MRKRLFILSFYIKLRKDITATVLKSASKARQYEPVIRRWGFYMKTEKLYFGAAYYSEYLPYDRVEKDMEMMEKAGMNVIRIAESTWSTLEPQEGVYDFTHIDRMLNAAACHHISVIVGTPTYAVPTWLVKNIRTSWQSPRTAANDMATARIWISQTRIISPMQSV